MPKSARAACQSLPSKYAMVSPEATSGQPKDFQRCVAPSDHPHATVRFACLGWDRRAVISPSCSSRAHAPRAVPQRARRTLTAPLRPRQPSYSSHTDAFTQPKSQVALALVQRLGVEHRHGLDVNDLAECHVVFARQLIFALPGVRAQLLHQRLLEGTLIESAMLHIGQQDGDGRSRGTTPRQEASPPAPPRDRRRSHCLPWCPT
jgi:hypothetical protein